MHPENILCLLLKMQITGKVRKVTTFDPQSALYHLRDMTTYLSLTKYFVSAEQVQNCWYHYLTRCSPQLSARILPEILDRLAKTETLKDRTRTK